MVKNVSKSQGRLTADCLLMWCIILDGDVNEDFLRIEDKLCIMFYSFLPKTHRRSSIVFAWNRSCLNLPMQPSHARDGGSGIPSGNNVSTFFPRVAMSPSSHAQRILKGGNCGRDFGLHQRGVRSLFILGPLEVFLSSLFPSLHSTSSPQTCCLKSTCPPSVSLPTS